MDELFKAPPSWSSVLEKLRAEYDPRELAAGYLLPEERAALSTRAAPSTA